MFLFSLAYCSGEMETADLGKKQTVKIKYDSYNHTNATLENRNMWKLHTVLVMQVNLNIHRPYSKVWVLQSQLHLELQI